jgi:choline dehydrogenase-like flavoprotein
MIADAGSMDRSALWGGFDVCVVGAGPAGITLARRLAAAGARVALMEAGGLEITEESQDVYRGTSVGM